MTKIEELEQKLDNAVEKFRLEINKFKAELENIKELAKESKKENVCKWKPQIGEKYWFRSTDNFIGWLINNCDTDEWRINNIPIFQTEEECKRYWRFIDTVKEKSYEFSKLEWADETVEKWFVNYEYCSKRFYPDNFLGTKILGTIYFATREDAQYIIDNFKDELFKYWL